jgi:hypothetical protein
MALRRAEALLQKHRRVREAARDLSSHTITPSLTVDVIGEQALLPDER